MNSYQHLLAGLAVAGSLLHAGESRLLNDGLLSGLRSEAARSHPAAVAGKYKAQAAAHEVRGVRLWNDPMIGVGFMGAKEMMRADDGDVMIGFEQALPKPGMFAAERAKMEAMHRAEIANSGNAALSAGAEAARAAIELALADESITLQQAQVDWMAAMVDNAKQMAADPMGSSTDALRMETELAKEQQMLDAARRSREGYARLLNITLGRPLDSPWPVLKLPASPPPVPVASAEVARIPHANPKVRSMKEMVSAANADARIADRERLPEVAVGVDTKLYSETGDIRSTTLGVKLSLPWFNDPAYKAKIDAAKSRELAAASDVETMRREIAGMVTMAATEAANAAAQARAYSGEIHDRALKASQTTEAAWISSKAPLTDLLDSARTLYAIRLEQRRMIAMQLAALEQLHTLVPNR
ncbi:MAG: TolC family protein [Akkermansiaceae bacterium]|jgi:outer membrane protein TolC|nr:TolC family protein [Akkermansiaceae bacterium]MCU0776163.1 TolC family protein [Akkermansiaceae bacterium]